MIDIALALAICFGINIAGAIVLVTFKKLLHDKPKTDGENSPWAKRVLASSVCGTLACVGFALVSLLSTQSNEIAFAKRLLASCVVFWGLIVFFLPLSVFEKLLRRCLNILMPEDAKPELGTFNGKLSNPNTGFLSVEPGDTIAGAERSSPNFPD